MPEQKHSSRVETIDIVLIFLVIVLLYLFLFKLPGYPFYYENDQLIFLENADRMLNGEVIYRDFFQFTFPGCQVIYYLLFLVFGAKFWLAGLIAIVGGAGSSWLCLRISKHVIDGPFAYMPMIAYAFFGLRWFGLDGSHRVLSPLFIWGAILILTKWPKAYFYAGACCACAAYITQNRGVAAVVGIAFFILVDAFADGRGWKSTAKNILSLLTGFLFSLLALSSYFLVTAGVGRFVWSTLIYPATYYRYYEQNNYGVFLYDLARSFSAEATLLEFLPAIFYSLVPLFLIVFFVQYFRSRNKMPWQMWRVPALLAVTGAFLIGGTAGPSYLRLYHVSVPALIVLFWMLDRSDLLRHRRKAVVIVAASLLFASMMVVAFRFQSRTDNVEIDAPGGKVFASPSKGTDRYLWLAAHTRPGDFLLEVYPSYVYFLLGLRPASRHSQFLPTDYTRPEFVSETVEDLKKTRPAFVIWNNAYNKPPESRDAGDHLGPLAELINSDYKPSGPAFELAGQPMQIWERSDQATSP